jgi:hypothetical protein
MAEKIVRVDVSEAVKGVVEASIDSIETEKSLKNSGGIPQKDSYKGVVEASLQAVAIRIVLSHSFEDLGKTLDGALTDVRAGGMNESDLDRLKGRVLDAVKNIKDGREGEVVSKFLDEHFRQGKYEEAAKFLKELAYDATTDLSDAEKVKIDGVLSKIKKESATTPAELHELAGKKNELHDENQDRVKDLLQKSDEVQMEIGKEELKIVVANKPTPQVDTKVVVNDDKRVQIMGELNDVNGLSKRDTDFIKKILIGDPEVDFSKMDRKMVYYIWYRTSGILGKKADRTGVQNTEAILKQMNESARAAILTFANENLVLEGISPSEARFLKLPKEEQDLINGNLNFIERTNGDFRKLLQYQEERMLGEEYRTRTDMAMHQLIQEYATKKPDFHLERKLRRNQSTNKWEWFGERKELFDVCRDEVYGIQGQLTQENMSSLVFEESAQKYLALMRIDVGDDLELEKVKDVITKTLYIEFAVKTMWRSGGNMEAWQRATMVLTQDSEENFFQLMDMGEMLKVKNKEGQEIEVGRFNWKDLMTLAELKAGNGQYYLTYMAGMSNALLKERKSEFAAALADMLVKKRLLTGEINDQQARDLMLSVQRGGFQFSDRQVRSMVDYMQFLEVATFRGGEFGLNESTVPGKFSMTSLPCGEVVQKTGPWSVIYDWYYPVTKYGGEVVGKIFLPNVNILSYRRGETLPQFIAKDTKVAAGMLDKAGQYHETGVGAKEYFFGGNEYGAVDRNGNPILNKEQKQYKESELWTEFWGDVIFDTRTGGVANKTAISRTVDVIRERGVVKLDQWNTNGQLSFVNHLDFGNFEMMLGYKIPGTNNMEKFRWMTENFDYSFWRTDLLPSKAVGDWVTKYVPKKYEDARLKLQAFLNTPGTATLGAARDIISEYTDESTFNEQAQAILKDNRKNTLGLRVVDKDGNEEGTYGYDAKTGQLKLVGYKHADRGKSKWLQEGAGDFYGVTEQWYSPFEGVHLGSGFPTSRQQGKELFRDPMYFEKMEIDNQFHAGMMSRKEWGEKKREFQMMAYFGDKIGETNFRPGYIPVLTPFFLFRGWWVDRMQLDWEDFMMVMRKNNEETWTKLKKIIGIS